MPPAWTERLARVRQSIDRELGETMLVTPMSASQYGQGGADAARPGFALSGPFAVGQGGEDNLSGGKAMSWRARIPTGQAELHVDPSAFPAVFGLRKGDRLTAQDRGDARYEIARIDRGQRNRIVLRLTAL